jgi:diacylglycerol kinase (ATP)
MSRYKIVVNPTSGRGEAGRLVPEIRAKLTELKLDFDLVTTEYPWHAAVLTQQAVSEGFDVVVAAGGDGTMNEVINGLMLAKRAGVGNAAMGALPVGRGNDFTYSFGIPMDWKEACECLARNQRRFIDIGHVTGGLYPDGRFLGNGVGIGFDAVVGFVAVKLKRLTGLASYLVAVLQTIFLYYKPPTVKIELDDEVITQSCLMVSIMNGFRLGGGFFIAPGFDPSDGLLDLCIVRKVPKLVTFSIVPLFLKGTQATNKNVQMKKSRRVVVTATQGTIPAHADGETLSTSNDKVTIELLPKQIEMVYEPGLPAWTPPA